MGASRAGLGNREIRAFVVYLAEVRGASLEVQKMYVAAIKFLYSVTLDRRKEVALFPSSE